MSDYVSLNLVKKQVRAEDFQTDDEHLQFLTDAAERQVVSMTQCDEARLVEKGDGDLPLPLKQAVLLLVGHWYNQREAVSGSLSEVPLGVEALVRPFRELAHD